MTYVYPGFGDVTNGVLFDFRGAQFTLVGFRFDDGQSITCKLGNITVATIPNSGFSKTENGSVWLKTD